MSIKIANKIIGYEVVKAEEEKAESIDEKEDTGQDEVVEEETYACPECGATVTPGMKVCPNCGVGLSFEIEEDIEDENKKNS